MKATKGISFALDGDNVIALEEPEGRECSGIVVCKHCTPEGVCGIDMEGRTWGSIPQCPQKKWYRMDMRSVFARYNLFDDDSCVVCGGKKHWRVKKWPYKGEAPKVCASCHPPEGVRQPGTFEYCTLSDSNKTAALQKPAAKAKKVKRAVTVRREKPAQGRIF